MTESQLILGSYYLVRLKDGEEGVARRDKDGWWLVGDELTYGDEDVEPLFRFAQVPVSFKPGQKATVPLEHLSAAKSGNLFSVTVEVDERLPPELRKEVTDTLRKLLACVGDSLANVKLDDKPTPSKAAADMPAWNERPNSLMAWLEKRAVGLGETLDHTNYLQAMFADNPGSFLSAADIYLPNGPEGVKLAELLQFRAIDYMNSIFEADPAAVRELLGTEAETNPAMADHPHAVCDVTLYSNSDPDTGERFEKITLTPLGVLSGLLAALGIPKVAAVVEDSTQQIQKFVPFNPRKRDG